MRGEEEKQKLNEAQELVDGTIKASWVLRTVETTNSDWIGLFAAGEVSNKYLASVYTHAASAGSVDIPFPKDTPAGMLLLYLSSSLLPSPCHPFSYLLLIVLQGHMNYDCFRAK